MQSKLPVVAAVPLAVLCGIGIAAQSRINGELGRALGNGQLAALVSFGTGLILVSLVVIVVRAAREGEVRLLREARARRFPWAFVFAGAAGGYFVLTQGLVAGIVGVALFTVAIVAGQTLSGMVIDRRGLGTMAARPITARRVIGAALALVAVAIGAVPQLQGDVPVLLLVLPLLAGAAIAWQQAANGQVREASGSVLTATFNNFVVGTAVLGIVVLVGAIWTPWPQAWPDNPLLYLGGPLGLLFIAIGASIVRTIGALLLGLCTIAGQLVASVVLDLVLPVPGRLLAASGVIAAGLALVAVLVASAPRRRGA